MPMLSFHASAPLAKKIRAAARCRGVPVSHFLKEAAQKQILRETGAPFGEWARKYAGIVRSGVGDLSTREGFGR